MRGSPPATTMPPVAKKWDLFEEGTAQRRLQDAVAARYDSAEQFFKAVAGEVSIHPDSAAGSFYGFIGGKRPLPASHQAAYRRLLGIDAGVLETIDSARVVTTPKRRDRLAELEATVAEMARVQALLLDELALSVDEQGRLASRKAPRRAQRRPGAGRSAS